jgi:hypothetical protein
MEVVCLEDQAFYALFDRLLEHVKSKQGITRDKWINGEEAMRMLRVTSKATMQKFRDEGKIRFSQPEKKIILYDVDSIHEFLNKHSHDTFKKS